MHTTQHNFVSKLYFNAIFKVICRRLDHFASNRFKSSRNHKVRVLDFGCGKGYFKQYCIDKNFDDLTITNYDINPILSDIDDPLADTFDVVVLNHVIMYLTCAELTELIKLLTRKGSLIIFGISKASKLTSVVAYILGYKNAHQGTTMSYEKQVAIVSGLLDVTYKGSIFGATVIIEGIAYDPSR
jgi:2-polyprenyl-3-methyl-5-hydroxy-6-metoxy-1,4-benzoquinol methylase